MRWRGRALSVVAATLGALAVVIGVDMAAEPYHDLNAFRSATPCSGSRPASANTCIAGERGRVEGARQYTTSSGGEHPTYETHHVLTVRRETEDVTELEVDDGVYELAPPGIEVGLQSWRGDVVRISVGDETSTILPSSAWDWMWSLLLAWAGVGLLLWSVCGGGYLGTLLGELGIRAFAWVFLGLWALQVAVRPLTWGFTSAWETALLAIVLLFGWTVSAGLLGLEWPGRMWRWGRRARR